MSVDKLGSVRGLALADISDKATQGVVTFLDIGIQRAKEAGWSSEVILEAVRNRLLTSFDSSGVPLPDTTPDAQAFADGVTDWQAVVKHFYARLRQERIPVAEVERAMPRGTPAWRALMKKWGAETAPDAGQERGSRAPGMTKRETRPGEPSPTPGEKVMQAARAAGKPITTYTDYQKAKAEFGGAA